MQCGPAVCTLMVDFHIFPPSHPQSFSYIFKGDCDDFLALKCLNLMRDSLVALALGVEGGGYPSQRLCRGRLQPVQTPEEGPTRRLPRGQAEVSLRGAPYPLPRFLIRSSSFS